MMKKRRLTALALTAALIGSMNVSPVMADVIIRNTIDGKTEETTFTDVPQRAVSLSGFATQMMMALGLEDKMVGYGYMDNEIPDKYKDAFSKLTCLADGNPSQEQLLAVEPDFLTGWASTFSEKNFPLSFCDENGIKAYVPQVEYAPASMESVYKDFENLGSIFGVEDRANEIVSDMKNRVQAVQDAVKNEDPVKVFIYDSGEDAPFTASAGLPTDMISLAGGKNVFADTKSNWTSVDWEDVINANPDYIIVMDYIASDPIQDKINFLKSDDALSNITAIKNNNISVIGLTDVTGCYESVDAIEQMAKTFHPDCFADGDSDASSVAENTEGIPAAENSAE